MKKILILALCAAAIGTVAAQVDAVKQAGKMAGKLDKLADARETIKGALANPETAQSADAWFTAGNIEFKAFDAAQAQKAIDPNFVPDMLEMSKQLLSGYDYFMSALPLDSIPNEKGQIKPKHSKNIAKTLAGHVNDYFNVAGVTFYNEKDYKNACRAFNVFGDMPEMQALGKDAPHIPDSIRAGAYFYAGVSAYSANDVDDAVKAFANARRTGYKEPEAWLYEIACWQSKMQKDEALTDEARANIYEIAKDGYDHFGIDKPVFINNMVDILVQTGRNDEALQLANNVLSGNESNPAMHALRAFVYDRLGNEEGALADYRAVDELEGADFDSLARAARYIARHGQALYNTIEGNSSEMRALRDDVKVNYFEKALSMAKKAQALNPTDSKNNDIIDSIEYNLSLIP